MRGWGRKGDSAAPSTARSQVAAGSGWPLRTLRGPFALTPERTRLLWFLLIVVSFLPIYTAINQWNDFSAFWSGGGTVGTPSLMDESLHRAWQTAHDVPADAWRYPPAFAFLYWPLAFLPIGLAFAVNLVVTTALVVVSAWLLGRIFSLETTFCLWLALAWTPTIAPLTMGQNAPLAVALALWAIDALRRDRPIQAGLAVGLMLYKPDLGLPLLGFLLLRAQWRALAVALAVAAVGYLVSVAGAAGDWLWPVAWLDGISANAAADLARNANKAVSIPALLLRVDVPAWLAYGAGGLIVLASLRGLIRAPLVEAAAAACLVGIVAGPRVWGYQAGLMLPILAWVVVGVAEPWRTRLVILATTLSILWMLSPATQLSGIAVVAAVAMVLWLRRWPPVAGRPAVPSSCPS